MNLKDVECLSSHVRNTCASGVKISQVIRKKKKISVNLSIYPAGSAPARRKQNSPLVPQLQCCAVFFLEKSYGKTWNPKAYSHCDQFQTVL